jgi:hypothetical protein
MTARRLRIAGLEVGIVCRAGSLHRSLGREASWILPLARAVAVESA